ncbi:hypothetical protein HUA76_00630 [Myxococcus sp. CA056]|uniref:hypothetical protein n=1 Tax=Myxococcus sp. CA056 TaxID=2741740 RepID=UPI00157B725A|nr:hypothetical protein [Myxococcus sp. CA056]NTX09271.1 hypothetical protein [Myxococcus sp. CA056]
MTYFQNQMTVRLKHTQGYNLMWNSNTGEVHSTGVACAGSHNLDAMVVEHMHFFKGYYLWDQVRWQLHISLWDPLTTPVEAKAGIRYSNCGHCKPERMAGRAA